MNIIKRRILLESFKSRNHDSTYGTFTASTININIPIYQEIKDLGNPQDLDYIAFGELTPEGSLVDYTTLINRIGESGFNFINNPTDNFSISKYVYRPDIRHPEKKLVDYFQKGINISGTTEDRLENVASVGYEGLDKYIPNKDVELTNYDNFKNELINGVTKVISNNNFNPITYTEDGNPSDINYASIIPNYQENGILFQTFTGLTRTFYNAKTNVTSIIPLTNVYYMGQGFNETNINLKANTRKEYLLHITEEPKVQSDIFIDRQGPTVFPSHTQLAEINTLEQLENFGNGFYNLIKV